VKTLNRSFLHITLRRRNYKHSKTTTVYIQAQYLSIIVISIDDLTRRNRCKPLTRRWRDTSNFWSPDTELFVQERPSIAVITPNRTCGAYVSVISVWPGARPVSPAGRHAMPTRAAPGTSRSHTEIAALSGTQPVRPSVPLTPAICGTAD